MVVREIAIKAQDAKHRVRGARARKDVKIVRASDRVSLQSRYPEIAIGGSCVPASACFRHDLRTPHTGHAWLVCISLELADPF
jgi:hypothetical protein